MSAVDERERIAALVGEQKHATTDKILTLYQSPEGKESKEMYALLQVDKALTSVLRVLMGDDECP